MTGRNIGQKVQGVFDWCQDCVSVIETRWLVFLAAVVVLVVMRALGAHGLSTLLALVYIMYFVTVDSRRHRRDL